MENNINEDDQIGKVDVLVENFMDMVLGGVEKTFGLNGLQATVRPFLKEGVKEQFGGKKINIKPEYRMLGEMLIRNWGKK